ncbi:MAG: hypothetical protein LUD12_16035 [Lachnospiraceae bacterium]|nr:hypothetical protein [Lachnospiraceae bacterium]
MATVNTNLIVPEVYAELVREKIAGRVQVGQFMKTVSTLQGNVGETVTFPYWAYIGDAEDWTVGTAMDATQIKQTTTTAAIKAIAAPGVEVYDYDDQVAMGNALNEAASQQAISIARKIDTDAIAAAYTTPLKVALADATAVTQDELLAALGVYGDERDAADFSNGAIVMHSTFASSLYGMDLFTSRERTTVASGSDNGITKNGVIGSFLGIDVVLSDRLYDATTQEAFILFVKNDSIGWIPKEAPFAEAARDASKRLTTVYCSEFYALSLLREDGIVLLKGTLPSA